MSAQPNVLFVLSDQHNAKVLGCAGDPNVKTPNFDRLAQQGTWLRNAIVQSPICTPSRVSYISGQYAHNHGYHGLSGPEPRGLPTVFGHFRRAGYRTAAIGKIHCPAHWVEDDCDCFHEACGCSVDGRSREYQKYLDDRGVREDHEALYELPDGGRQKLDGRASFMSYEDSMEGWSVRRAQRFMGECVDEGTPFFAHVSLPKPHQCYTPSEPFWSMYDESELTLPPNADYNMVAAGKSPGLIHKAETYRSAGWTVFEPKTFEAGRLRKLHGYLGNLSHVDHAVGELLDWLDEKGIAEDTIVVYSADHGDFACEHGQMEKAPGICADAITRVPMFWRWGDRIQPGRQAEQLVEAVDVAPTLCGLVGVGPMRTADGKDISGLLQGDTGEVRQIAVTEHAWSKSVRCGRWRLVYYPREMWTQEYPEGFGELYDLETDPWEMTNLYFRPDLQDVVRDLERQMLDWLVTTRRPVTVLPHSNHVGDGYVRRYGNSVAPDGKIAPDDVRATAAKTNHYI